MSRVSELECGGAVIWAHTVLLESFFEQLFRTSSSCCFPLAHRPGPRRSCHSKRCVHPSVHSSTVYNSWYGRDPRVHKRWVDKEDTIHTHTPQWNIALKRKEMMSFVATWMDLAIIILRDVNQTKTTTIWYQLNLKSKKKSLINLWNTHIKRWTDPASKLMATKGWGRDE